MALGSWFTLAWYGPAAGASRGDTPAVTVAAGVKGDVRPDASISGAATIPTADATRLVNSPASSTGAGSITSAPPLAYARPALTVSIGSRPSAVDNAEAVVAQRVHTLDGDMTIGDALAMLVRLARNQVVTDPVAGTFTVYDDDDTTVLYTADLWADADGTTPYSGSGAERRDRLT